MSAPYSAPRRLERSRNDRFIGGVCGGIAKYLNMDPTLVRILTVVITLFTFVPVVAYIIAMFVMPEESPVDSDSYPPVDAAGHSRASRRTRPTANTSRSGLGLDRRAMGAAADGGAGRLLRHHGVRPDHPALTGETQREPVGAPISALRAGSVSLTPTRWCPAACW